MTERADLAQRTKHAFRWVATTTILWQAISWAMTFWTVRVLHPSDYGLMAFAETVFPYAMLIASLDVGAWLIHKTTLYDDDRHAATSIALTLGTFVAAALLLTAPLFARFYGQPGLVGILRVLSIAVVARSLTVVPEALLRRSLRFRELGLVSIAVGLARGITQVSLAHQGWGTWSLVTGLVVKEVLESALIVRLGGLHFSIGAAPLREYVWRALSYATPLTLANVLWVLWASGDLVIVGKLFSTEMLGAYAIAATIANMPMSKVSQLIRPVLLPYFSRVREETGSLGPSFMKTNRLLAAVMQPTLMGLAATASEALPVFLGPKWSGAIRPLQALALVAVLRSASDAVPLVLMAEGKTHLNLFLNAASALIVLPCLALGGLYGGLDGLLGTWLLAQALIIFLSFRVSAPLLGYSVAAQLMNLAHATVASAFMVACVVVCKLAIGSAVSRVALLGIEVAVGAATYVAAYGVFYRQEARELIQLGRSVATRG